MITVADPQILWNDGFYPLVDVTIPDGSFWKPKHPAALNARNHGIGRVFDLFGGLLGQTNPALLNAAGFSSSPHFMYSGNYSERRPQGRVVPAVLDRLRRHPRPAARRRAGRPLAVAVVRQHPLRVPRVVLPAADREVGDRRRHRRSGAAPRRQRRRRRLPVPGAGHDRHPRRPLADLPVGRQRRRARRARAQVGRPGRRHAARCCRSKCHDVPVLAGRRAALRHLGRRRLGRPAGARPGAGGPRGAARAGHRRGRAARTGWCVDEDGAVDAAATDGAARLDARRPAGRAAGVRHGSAAGGAAGALRGGDRPAGAEARRSGCELAARRAGSPAGSAGGRGRRWS